VDSQEIVHYPGNRLDMAAFEESLPRMALYDRTSLAAASDPQPSRSYLLNSSILPSARASGYSHPK
jgi:hypothetical protein